MGNANNTWHNFREGDRKTRAMMTFLILLLKGIPAFDYNSLLPLFFFKLREPLSSVSFQM